ncbi:hypothetical protein LTS18_004962, partial [Coniosporium uncinatum]
NHITAFPLFYLEDNQPKPNQSYAQMPRLWGRSRRNERRCVGPLCQLQQRTLVTKSYGVLDTNRDIAQIIEIKKAEEAEKSAGDKSTGGGTQAQEAGKK